MGEREGRRGRGGAVGGGEVGGGEGGEEREEERRGEGGEEREEERWVRGRGGEGGEERERRRGGREGGEGGRGGEVGGGERVKWSWHRDVRNYPFIAAGLLPLIRLIISCTTYMYTCIINVDVPIKSCGITN